VETGGETEWSAEYSSDYKWKLLVFALHDLTFGFSATVKKEDEKDKKTSAAGAGGAGGAGGSAPAGAKKKAEKKTEKKAKISAEFDIGRYEKMGEIEIELEAPDGDDQAGTTAQPQPPASGGSGSGGAAPPASTSQPKKQWAKWEATLKLKPGAALALRSMVHDVLLPIWSAQVSP
jgi:hypothetical protein